jgi:hypothetical protein
MDSTEDKARKYLRRNGLKIDFSRNKRGQVQYFLENAFRIGFLMIALVVFFLLVNFYIVNRIDTTRLQSEVTADRIMYSNTLMYEENSRTYIGIVDIKKFNDATIDAKINYPVKRHATAKLELVNNANGTILYTAYLNKAQYQNLLVISTSGGQGKGGAISYTKDYPVTYIDSGKYSYGTIKMNVIIPKS